MNDHAASLQTRIDPSLDQTLASFLRSGQLSIARSAEQRSIMAAGPACPGVSCPSRLRALCHVFGVGMALLPSLAWTVVGLVTPVTACALTVDPNGLPPRPNPRVMLVWQQSGGEPWPFSAPGQGWPRVFPTVQDAIREARTSVGGQIRVGLTGLPADKPAATAEMFAPCPNIAFAASQIAQLSERGTILSRFKADPIYCAIAAYRGSWEPPDAVFADAVKATVVKGDAQNFDMSEDAYFDTNDAAGDALKPDPHAAPTALGSPSDDHDRAWSSALFPLKLSQAEPSSTDVPNRGPSAIEMRSHGREAAVPTAATPPSDSLFVPSSTRRRPW